LWAYAGVVGAYVLLVLLFSLVLGVQRREIGLVTLLPLVFVAVHLGAGVGLWWEALSRLPAPRSRRWAA
jgi:hypothetical protein